ncbi:MAG: hypothetical protein JETT_0385 [Candidatus Jettenia ecosi]|uniref:Uncharacterized protein n=1 Tax=Candidatus Jettenia ecosi TaxID=2494326 RepID=A0A533QRZ0_9BACT|nr:MAG: hypothetical protein JETT_0385 [Candidatus Jettenia ecosi]
MKPNSILDRVAQTNLFVRDGVVMKSWLILSGFIMCCSV